MPDAYAMISEEESASGLGAAFRAVRDRTLALTAGLGPEDMVVQSMPDASPTKWHLAHTSWFFEHFILIPMGGGKMWRPGWDYLFNSYYEAVGPRHPRILCGDGRAGNYLYLQRRMVDAQGFGWTAIERHHAYMRRRRG